MTPNKEIRIIRLFSIVLLILVIACDKVSAFDVESNEERMNRQTELLKMVDSRAQVSDFTLYPDYFKISFTSDDSFRLSYEGTPVFSIGNENEWLANGINTGEVVQHEGDNIRIPDIHVGETGNWIIDEFETTVPAHAILTPEDLEMSYISHIVTANDWLYFFLYAGGPIRVPIIRESFYHVPAYFLDSLVKKERMAEAILKSAGEESASFVFFTDTHWGKNMKHSPALIRHIIDYTPLDDVIFGGDVVTSHSTNLVTPMETGRDFQESFSFLGTRFHCLFGNHDDNSASQPNKTEYHLSEEQVFSFLQSQMKDVTSGDYYNFYYDNPVTKTRIIGLDTGRYYYSAFRYRLPDTVQFAIDALNTLPPDWHAIFASHIWCKATNNAGVYTYYIDSFIKPILKVFDNYNARKSGKYSYGDTSLLYDFTDAGGSVEFCIGGHIHNLFISYSDGGIPVVNLPPDYLINTSDKGSYKEQSVTIAIADYREHKLHLFVVGRGSNRVIDIP